MPHVMLTLLAASAALSLVYGLFFSGGGRGMRRSILKTVPVSLLAVAALLSSAPPALVAALGLGAVGDFWLSRPGQRAFLAGLVAFALAHLALVWLYWPPFGLSVTALAVLPVALALGMGVLLAPRAGALRVPALAYAAIIAAMGVVVLQPGNSDLAKASAILFMASDACLGLQLFVLPAAHRIQSILSRIIWFSYWAAQAGFLMDHAMRVFGMRLGWLA